jgi:hypothetical protein
LQDLTRNYSATYADILKTYNIDNINENIVIVIPKICSTTKEVKGVIIHKNQSLKSEMA